MTVESSQQVSISKVSAVGVTDDIPATGVKVSENAGSSNRPSLPPIVVKDAFGQHLDTDSGYQKAINQARWTVAHRTRDTPIGPEEWRLPGGPLPARPDFSRMAPPRVVTNDVLRTSLPERGYVSTGCEFSRELVPKGAEQDVFQKVRGIRKRSNSLPDLLDAVEGTIRKEYMDLNVSLEKISTLPPLTAAAVFRQSFKKLPKRKYISIAHAFPEGQEQIVDDFDLRRLENIFPGFSYGYRRAGLCYGCEKGPGPHVHEDRPVRTGGGFTYFRRDFPVGANPRKNPLYWKLSHLLPYDKMMTGMKLPQIESGPVDWSGDDDQHFHLAADTDEMEIDSGRGRSLTTDGADTLRSDDSGLLATGKLVHARLPALVEANTPEHNEDDLKRGKLFQATLADFLDISKALDGSLGPVNGGAAPSTEPLQPPLQYIGKLYKGTQARENIKSSLQRGVADPLVYMSEGISGGAAPAEEVFRNPVLPKIRTDVGDKEEEGRTTEDEFSTTERRSRERETFYKASPAFKPKPSDKRATVSRSPFSTNRNLHVPESKGIDIKKSDKSTTKFIDTKKRPDVLWQEPKKFELEEREKVPIAPWIKPQTPAKPKQPSPPQPIHVDERSEDSSGSSRPSSRDSGVEVPDQPPTLPRSPSQEPPREKTPEVDTELLPPPLPPPPPPPPPRPPRIEQIKHIAEVKETEIPKQQSRDPTPAPPTPQTEEEVEEEEYVRIDDDESEYDRVELPPVPSARPPEPPPLPEWNEPEMAAREISQTDLEIPPAMHEPPAQRQPVTQRIRKRPTQKKRKYKPSVAPVTKKDLREMQDPLDYLAKYCIVHPDRLPLYERVFYDVTSGQPYRFGDVPDPPFGQSDVGFDDGTVVTAKKQDGSSSPESGVADLGGNTKNFLTEHEKRMIQEFILVNRQLSPDIGIGMSKGEEMVSKVNYTLDSMIDKYEQLQNKLEEAEENRIKQLAELTRTYYPDVAKPEYVPVAKKSKKKKKKKDTKKGTKAVTFTDTDMRKQVKDGDNDDDQGETKRDVSEQSKIKHLRDVDIVNRLDQKQMTFVLNHTSVHHSNLEIERLKQKLRQTDDRIEDLEDEKRLMQLYSRDDYLHEQTAHAKPTEFMRRQSHLFQKLNPQVDLDMNLNELEDALQQINGQLMTDKEMQYVYHILDLPGRRRINVKLFSVVAALSEKVAQVEPLIKKLINKFDFEALSIKMDKCKELFYLLDEKDDDVPDGMVTVKSLVVELMAGGVSPEHTQYVIQKFNREKKGVIDFLDFLTYVPLFIEIHERIIRDPLNQERTL